MHNSMEPNKTAKNLFDSDQKYFNKGDGAEKTARFNESENEALRPQNDLYQVRP